MKTLKFKTNINCNNCIRSVTPFLNEIDSIEEWKVDIENPKITGIPGFIYIKEIDTKKHSTLPG
jgi:copper chaperone